MCATEQVVTGQYCRNGLCLDGGGCFVALLEYGPDNGWSQVKIFKVHSVAPILGAMASASLDAVSAESVKGRWDTKVEQLR